VEKTRTRYEKVKVPCFHVAGWFDFYPAGTFNHFLSMKEKGGTPLARRSQHILMGPWLHLGPSTNTCVGDMNLDLRLTLKEASLASIIWHFFNKYLKGMDIELPSVRYFVMGENVWRNARPGLCLKLNGKDFSCTVKVMLIRYPATACCPGKSPEPSAPIPMTMTRCVQCRL